MPANSNRSIGSLVWRVLAVLAILIIAGVAWTIYSAASTAIRAENNLHSSLFVVRLVEEHVQMHGRWPSSWQDLEEMTFGGDAYSPSNGELSAVRIGGAQEFDWPSDAERIKKQIKIDFDVDIAIVAKQGRMEFDAIEPFGPTFEYRDYGIVESLQETLRKLVDRDSVPR